MPFEIVRNDIVNMQVDAVVNTANPNPVIGSGVDSGIHKKAGPELLVARKKIGCIDFGDAVITPGFGLDAKYVIHTVGPVYHGTEQDALDLQACYWNTLSLAYDYLIDQNLNRLNLAFPCISTGIFGYPHEEACTIAVSTVQKLMRQYPDAKRIHVTFVCYLEEDYLLYKKELKLR